MFQYLIHPELMSITGLYRKLFQMSSGESRVTTWTRGQFITGPKRKRSYWLIQNIETLWLLPFQSLFSRLFSRWMCHWINSKDFLSVHSGVSAYGLLLFILFFGGSGGRGSVNSACQEESEKTLRCCFERQSPSNSTKLYNPLSVQSFKCKVGYDSYSFFFFVFFTVCGWLNNIKAPSQRQWRSTAWDW